MKKVIKSEFSGQGQLLGIRLLDESGARHEFAFDAAALEQLLRSLIGATLTPSAPKPIQAAQQAIAAKTVRIGVHGAATPVLIQELEAEAQIVTTIERADLQRLRDECDRALEAMPRPTSH